MKLSGQNLMSSTLLPQIIMDKLPVQDPTPGASDEAGAGYNLQQAIVSHAIALFQFGVLSFPPA